MAVNLSKHQKITLTKEDGKPLVHAIAGMGWDVNRYDGGGEFDLDVSAFLIGKDGKVRNERDFIFYKNPTDDANSVRHLGDNRTGAGDGDDEQIVIDLSAVPADVEKISITCTIYDADTRKQTFGAVENAYIRIYDADTNAELARFDLTEDKDTETALVVGQFYRHNGTWKFTAIGEGFNDGLAGLCRTYGLDVE